METVIGVISDTHDQIDNLKTALEYYAAIGVSEIIHCGDWVAPFTLGYYKQAGKPIYGVFGNNDGDIFRHIQIANDIGLNSKIEDQFLCLERWGRVIGIYHGLVPDIVEALINCGKYDALFYGHSHIPSIRREQKTLALNPGSLLEYTRPGVEGATIGLYYPDRNEGRIVKLSEVLAKHH